MGAVRPPPPGGSLGELDDARPKRRPFLVDTVPFPRYKEWFLRSVSADGPVGELLRYPSHRVPAYVGRNCRGRAAFV